MQKEQPQQKKKIFVKAQIILLAASILLIYLATACDQEIVDENRLSSVESSTNFVEPSTNFVEPSTNFEKIRTFVDQTNARQTLARPVTFSALWGFIPVTDTNTLLKIRGQGQPVIFLHGMSDTSQTWNSLISALPDKWFTEHEVWMFDYDWRENIARNAADLIRQVASQGSLKQPILIGHSMGGLVARSYIAQGGDFAKLVTIGTPHLGTILATSAILSKVFPSLDFSGVADMIPNSPFIQDLDNYPREVKARSQYVSFAGEMTYHWDLCQDKCLGAFCPSYPCWKWTNDYWRDFCYGFFFFTEANDGVVPVDSALPPRMNNQPLLRDLDHGMIKDADAKPVINYLVNQL